MSNVIRGVVALAVLGTAVGRAYAQSGDAMGMPPSEGRLAIGGEVSAVAGPADNSAFFNYTDYDQNSLRIARIRLLGELRLGPRLSVVGELRTENADEITAPGLYLRWRPRAGHDFFIQAGRIPPVIGSFPRRAYDRDNAVISQPLAYQYLTSLRPDALPATTDDLLAMRGRGWQPSFPVGAQSIASGTPLVSVSKWDTGGEATWEHGWLDAAAALSRGSPAIPVVRDTNGGLMWSTRLAGHWTNGLTVGLSGARGEWLNDSVLALTPGDKKTPASQALIGADAEFGRGPWLVRSEWLRTSFELPLVGMPDPATRLGAWSAFIEARYRFLPRWQVGVRVDRLSFSTIQSLAQPGVAEPWDAPVSRAEATLGFRVTHRLEVRGGWQEDARDGGRVRTRGYPAASVLYWF